MFEKYMNMFFMAPEDGTGGSGTSAPAEPSSPEPSGTEPEAGTSQDTEQSTDKESGFDVGAVNGEPDKETGAILPKYHTQIDPTKGILKTIKKLIYGKETITDLADAFIELSGRHERSLEIPGKDATQEEIKAFMGKLGVPESPDKYDLSLTDTASKHTKDLAERMKKEFYRAGMTNTQARAMWNQYMKYTAETVKELKAIDDRQKEYAKTFDARLSKSMAAEYPNKADRDSAMKETVNLANKFMKRTGLGKVLANAGLTTNIEVIHAIAAEERDRVGSSHVAGKPGTQKGASVGAFGDDYSSDFKDYAGRR